MVDGPVFTEIENFLRKAKEARAEKEEGPALDGSAGASGEAAANGGGETAAPSSKRDGDDGVCAAGKAQENGKARENGKVRGNGNEPPAPPPPPPPLSPRWPSRRR
jgi:hypothetical protein